MTGPGRHAAVGILILIILLPAGCHPGGDPDRASSAAATRGDAIERRAEKGPVTLLVRVGPRSPRLSDLVAMDIRVEAPPGVEIRPPAFGEAVGDFLIRDYTERPPEPGAANRRRFHYELEPAHAGKHLIRSVAVEFVDRREESERRGEPGPEPALVETDPIEVDVTSDLKDEAPSLARLEPMVPPRPVPQAVAIGWVIASILAGVLVLLAVAALLRRRRRPVEPRRRTPEEVAGEALAALLAEDLPGRGLVKEFYLRLTAIVRRYVEDTTGIRAPEQTTEEFLRDVRARAVFPPDRSVRLAEFLEAADLVKYAGQLPREGQVDGAIARAHEFVNVAPAAAEAAAGG
jgi:hypothetical protein